MNCQLKPVVDKMADEENPSIVELIGQESLNESEDDADYIFDNLQSAGFGLSKQRIRESAQNTLYSLKRSSRKKAL